MTDNDLPECGKLLQGIHWPKTDKRSIVVNDFISYLDLNAIGAGGQYGEESASSLSSFLITNLNIDIESRDQ